MISFLIKGTTKKVNIGKGVHNLNFLTIHSKFEVIEEFPQNQIAKKLSGTNFPSYCTMNNVIKTILYLWKEQRGKGRI